MMEEYEQRLGRMTQDFLEDCGTFLQEARDLETLYFQVTEVLKSTIFFLTSNCIVIEAPYNKKNQNSAEKNI